MPDLPVDVSDEARKILAEEFRSVAIVGYRFGPERIPVMFVALEDESGAWWDLHGHQLSITPETATEEDKLDEPTADGAREA